ncbi:hypothetical protein TanjilG_14596 [Lupinus angustifolius]|uniref:Thioesterase domain-containing protein n=1 Tax=Lupinus angustifolius TaxID=3871 RepID=A0A1J7HI79_LUPAN|nr:PREDICTED: uncharacterized protein LOC109359308 [Lupinus angustifolius]OIW02073.1 hypothetical protein TanjilG_14596 [Lupinus angustifolius]
MSGTAAKPSSNAETEKSSKEAEVENASEEALLFLKVVGHGIPIPEEYNTNGFFSNFLRSFINVHHIQRGQISCTILAKLPIANGFGTLHGGAVGSFVEVLATACARTVVAEDKELFLGEISISYLSGTPLNEEVLANASVVKRGRNLTVVTVEFKLKKTGNLLYISHATFYNMPVARL